MGQGYWQEIARRRINRRAALRGTAIAGLGVAALSLIGCGSDENGSGGASSSGSSSSSGGGASSGASGASSGLLYKPVDTSGTAKRGGVLPSILTSDTPSFSAYHSVAVYAVQHNDRAYSKFFKPSVANRANGEASRSTVDPDVISSYETSPDGLTITMKLRTDVAFDPRPPTNGRKVTVDDVNYSWQQFKTLHKSRGLLANEVNKNAPIASITTPDSSTIVMKLAFPSPSLLPTLAFYLNAPFIYPTEAESQFNQNSDMRGSGPWLLDKYTPSASFSYRRNPNYYDKVQPYLDGIDLPLISEYADQMAQFQAGRIYSFGMRSEDIVPTKKQKPELNMVSNEFTTALGGMVWFDFRPNKGSIWFDDRVRQALSMTVDRDLFIETLSNVKSYTDVGIPVDTRWNSHVPGGETEFWLDPQGKDFGDTAKYFQYNLDEATKLVQAASGNSRMDTAWTIVQGNDYGQAYHQQADVLQAMFNQGPFNFKTVPLDYSTAFVQKASAPAHLTGGHDFDGAAYGLIPVFPEIDSLFANHYVSGGAYYKFEDDYPNDPKWNDFLHSQQIEQDPQRRASIIKDFQRYAAGKMYVLPFPGQANTFSIAWPWVGNFGAFATRGQNTDTYLWLDKA